MTETPDHVAVRSSSDAEIIVTTGEDGALLVEVVHPCDWPESAAGPEDTRVWVNDGLVYPAAS
ncbi:hypothetical protein [Actinokineospora iranica]|uniref:hypothetical protein n=1 Tax=Actinokineospora iranica TaxID=1271860 RepID=UPI00111417D0|nr:hypothetical protein [Actinokineospora iranica]